MKKILIITILTLFGLSSIAQTDSIYEQKRAEIQAKMIDAPESLLNTYIQQIELLDKDYQASVKQKHEAEIAADKAQIKKTIDSLEAATKAELEAIFKAADAEVKKLEEELKKQQEAGQVVELKSQEEKRDWIKNNFPKWFKAYQKYGNNAEAIAKTKGVYINHSVKICKYLEIDRSGSEVDKIKRILDEIK